MKTRKKGLKIKASTLFIYAKSNRALASTTGDPTTTTITTSTVTGTLFAKG